MKIKRKHTFLPTNSKTTEETSCSVVSIVENLAETMSMNSHQIFSSMHAETTCPNPYPAVSIPFKRAVSNLCRQARGIASPSTIDIRQPPFHVQLKADPFQEEFRRITFSSWTQCSSFYRWYFLACLSRV
ncbi:hypothetical protein RF11_05189 [Thelohanellus kitauei]|uniref:Uncharacterized protein n=1 Tax=Thelohanellus kitauei TaxID=669202 RepID=A0A0C2J7W9_THEKT|nr:hypothetical protein RF11_05189 [Thelohanellus kitauei]